MNNNQLPHSPVILLFILIAVTFVVGTLRAFVPARAGLELDEMAQNAVTPTPAIIAEFPTPTPLSDALLPAATEEVTPSSTPIPYTKYADTTGIIALAILLVVVVLVGTIIGERIPRAER